MTTNFFQSIADLRVAGDWKITIANEEAGRLIVSVHFYNEQVGDEARKLIPPLLLKGTPAEIDAGFFEAIAAPVQETAQLLVNMEQYRQQQEQARKQSQMEKDKAEKAEKERKERQKRVDEALKKVDELEAEGKYRDAWLKVPDPADHPEQAEALAKRKTELAKQFAPDLFHVEPTNE
ncbi:MAG: PRTRC system protein E [Bacteroidetes bacterium]|nr:PRTRC system protein E [Bacteroidota bacterium]